MFLVTDNILVVRAFAMGAERTVETTQLAPRFGGQREQLMAIKSAESLFSTFYFWYFQHSFLLILSFNFSK